MGNEVPRLRARFEIDVVEIDPPSGEVRVRGVTGVEELKFEGWLGLLATVEHVVAAADESTTAGGATQ